MTTPLPLGTYHAAAPVVFISSTVLDLADLRSGIKYMLRQRGVNVLMSEASDFPLQGDRSAVDECFENIRNCDYYILLVDKRCGSLYRPGVSVTRQELRIARESFALTGKPHQLLFVRRGVPELAKRRNSALREAGVDDPRHLRSFIKEITNPTDPNFPNFLKEFGTFEEIMDSITARLNLGRNVAESLVRRSVYMELIRSLANMVSRQGSGAIEKHAALTTIREQFDFTSLLSTHSIIISEHQRTRLALGVLGRVKASFLEAEAMRDAVREGVFLDYDPSTGTLTETRIQQALAQVLEDVTALASLDHDPWDERILLAIMPPGPYEVRVFDLASAFGFANRAENLFNSMRQACWLLTGSAYSNMPVPRLPATPFGHEEDLRIRKERVEPWEVNQLFAQDIHPFGGRLPSEVGQATREVRLRNVLESLSEAASSNPQFVIDASQLRSIAEAVVDRTTANPGEGLTEPTV